MTRKEYERLKGISDAASAAYHAAWDTLKKTPEFAECLRLRADWNEARSDSSNAYLMLPHSIQNRINFERKAATQISNEVKETTHDAPL